MEVAGRAARGVWKQRVRSAASTRWDLARSAGRARAYLIDSCRAGRASRELRHADGGSHVGPRSPSERALKIVRWGADTTRPKWLPVPKCLEGRKWPASAVGVHSVHHVDCIHTRVKLGVGRASGACTIEPRKLESTGTERSSREAHSSSVYMLCQKKGGKRDG